MSSRPNNLPPWVSLAEFDRVAYSKTLSTLNASNVNTVCIEANCPNRYECFSNNTATFMILGDQCTRDCKYCNVKHGKPMGLDKREPKQIARVAKQLGLRYVVITCVARDDLSDGGAGEFVETVLELRKQIPECKIELLVSDFNGNINAFKKILGVGPDVLNHNIEIVKSLFPLLRPQGSYARSINILRAASGYLTKSGLMVGLGETDEQIFGTLKDLAEAKVDLLTIGQYLQPSLNHAPVKKYYSPEEFKTLRRKAIGLGFKKVAAGPLVRSSYHARKMAE